jgi:hypothetical protein
VSAAKPDALMNNSDAFVVEERPSESPFVEKVWLNNQGGPSAFTSVANANCELVFTTQQGRTYVHLRGPETVPTSAETPEEAEFFGIIFKVGTFVPGLTPASLVNSGIELPVAAWQSFRFGGSTWEIPTFENADQFVARLVNQGLIAIDPVVTDVLQGHSRDLSARSLQSRFRRTTGLTHGTIRQILRAQKTVRLLRQGVPISDVIHDTGYFDQAHLTRSLKRFIGQTPGQLVTAQGPISYF